MQVNSASIDHSRLMPGLHLTNKLIIGDAAVYEYDLRFIRPVSHYPAKILDDSSIHTMEHLLAYYLRVVSKAVSSQNPQETILSVYPYGCKTGFGCLSLFKPSIFADVLVLALEAANLAKEIPFNSTYLCGNAFLNDLEQAKKDLAAFQTVLLDQLHLEDPEGDSIVNVPRIEGTEEPFTFLPLTRFSFKTFE